MKWLELFSGIGGAAAALPPGAVVRAVDHDEHAHQVYVANHGDHAIRRNLASVRPELLAGADAWWMSPPCQPYTVRGKGRDLDDPRAASLVHLLDLLEQRRVEAPRMFAMENVPGFSGSRAHGRVRAVLRGLGYQIRELEMCPTALGVPMVRRRFYLLADREGAVPEPAKGHLRRPLGELVRDDIDPSTHPELFASDELLQRYGRNLPLVDPTDPEAVTHCFTGAYGRSPVYSGSWLVTPDGPRLLLPGEIARILGFADDFRLPVKKVAKAYKLVGNALSVDVVRALLSPWYDEGMVRRMA